MRLRWESILKIKNIAELSSTELADTIRIFFETSTVKSFENPKFKELFLYRYFGYYQEFYPEYFLIALDGKKENCVVGYTCGHPMTFSDIAIDKLQTSLDLFKEIEDEYPAHLHINVSANAQGQGVGSFLISAIEDLFAKKSISGVHIITSCGSKNVKFYERNGFDFKLYKKVNNAKLLLMGKRIKSNA